MFPRDANRDVDCVYDSLLSSWPHQKLGQIGAIPCLLNAETKMWKNMNSKLRMNEEYDHQRNKSHLKFKETKQILHWYPKLKNLQLAMYCSKKQGEVIHHCQTIVSATSH